MIGKSFKIGSNFNMFSILIKFGVSTSLTSFLVVNLLEFLRGRATHRMN